METIELRNISKVYGSGAAGVTAVHDVNLTIDSGEFFFLLGPSGCGKTTLLRMIAGLIDPSGGGIFFGGRDVTGVPVESRGTAMVFQNYALWPHMTVGQNVQFGPRMQGRPAAERKRVAGECLALVEMGQFERRRPNQLSGGQQQRVALARALAARPSCLLLDEPLSNLDARLRLHMRGELRGLVKASKTTAIYVTHDQKEALSMADRIAVMNDGKVVQTGTPDELYRRPATRFVADFLGEANFISGRPVNAAGGAAVATAAGNMAITGGAAAAGASSVLCCVRPEHIRIEATAQTAPAGVTSLPAVVVSQMFLGEIRQYVCRLESGDTWKVTALAGGAAHAAGQKVSLRFAPQDVAVLPE